MHCYRSSAHYHILSGLFLAYDVYRPAFSSTSPYIRGTFRDDEKYLWIFAGLLAVRSQSPRLEHSLILDSHSPVLRAVKFLYTYDTSKYPTCRKPEACRPIRLRLWPCLLPQLLL